MLSSTPELDRTLLRFDGPGQYIALKGDDELALDRQDFMLVVAGSLSCKPLDPSLRQALVTRFEKDAKGRTDKVSDEKGRGLRLFASRGSEQPSQIATCSDPGAAPQCVTALVSDVACNQMQLFTLSRFTPDRAEASSRSSEFELRHNAVTAAQVALDADMSLSVDGQLRVGGRGLSSWIGDVALVTLVVGKVSPRDRCELERFVLTQLAAADMATAAELPDCSAL
jgi:hypothetical protein